MRNDSNRLIREFGQADPKTLEDLWLILARNVEDSLIDSDAQPGKDYTRLDLYKLAQPFVLDMFQRPGNEITFTVEWPSDSRKDDRVR